MRYRHLGSTMMLRGAAIALLVAALVTAPVSVEAREPIDANNVVACYPVTGCSSDRLNPDEEITIRECCVSNPQGVAYQAFGSELCIACQVYGWTPLDNNVRTEQGQGYTFEVSFFKPRGTNQEFTFPVTGIDGTAEEGASKDYTINTRSVTFSQTTPGFVTVTFRVDSVGLEERENFQLRLGPESTASTSDGVFFVNTLDLVIEDSDDVILQLTEDDYRGGEQELSIRVDVTKSSRIATDLVLMISPIILSDARAMNLIPPGVDLPNDNLGRSPIEADLNDFNNTIQTFTFRADENEETPISEISLLIPINDDAINEATEQDFVVVLNVVDTVNINGTEISRPSSLCRIIDNDPIMIGFEMEIYTFEEPEFDEFFEIFLAKENDVRSEQTFGVSILVSDFAPPNTGFAIAEFDVDYRDIQRISTTIFPFQLQRIPISFNLISDVLPEQTEAFQINSASDGTPDFNVPNALFQRAYVVIDDDDVIVRIGYENITYTVDEDIGTLEVCVRVLAPDDSIELPLTRGMSITAVVETIPGTADAADYEHIDPAAFSVVLFFDNTVRRECFDVMISDDMLVEGVEQFSINLMNEIGRDPPIELEYFPNVTVITINDMDEAVIGFIETNYTAEESDGFVTLTFGLISGGVQEAVDVALTLTSGSATVGSDFDGAGGTFTFDRSRTVYDFNVTLEDDDVYEFTENFFAQLSFVGTPPERVSIGEDMAQVEVDDDDVIEVGFSPDRYSELESAGTVDLGVSIIMGSFGTAPISVQLSFETSSGTAEGSTSLTAGDYISIQQLVEVSGLLTIPVTIINDDFTEINETFGASLSDPQVLVSGVPRSLSTQEAARVIVQPATATVEILDNDVTTIGFRQPTYSAAEDAGPISFMFGILSGMLQISVPITFATSDSDAFSHPAQAGVDYLSVNQVFVFNSTFVDASAPVDIIDDDIFELVENFNGLLSSTSLPPNVRISPDSAIGGILEEAAITLGWNELMYTTTEGNPTITLCASITTQTELDVDPFTLNLQYSDVSATMGSDYVINSISIGPYSKDNLTACVDVQITDDNRPENTEQFIATLVASSNSPQLLVIQPEDTTVTIIDNDVIMVGWEEPIYITDEGTDTVELCAVVRSPSSANIDRDTFTLTTSCIQASAVENYDYEPCPGSIGPFDLTQNPPRACIQVDINDDPIPEDRESFIAVLTTPTDPLFSIVSGEDQTNVTIVDNDVIQVTLDPTPEVTVTETQGSAMICVQISSPPETTEIQRGEFYVSISTMDGSATDPSDYMGVDMPNFGPFSNESRRLCVDIPVVLDTMPEMNENFKVSITEEVDGVSITGAMTTVTIVDSIRRINDTVVGDPLMTVPIFLPNNTVIPSLGENDILNLCYEVHGEDDATFNLVSDGCVSVNSHYTQVRPTESQNIIDAVYVRAVDNEGACLNITVDLEGCAASVNGVSMERYSRMGVSVRRYVNRVRIAVPNCQELDLIMWVICESRTFWSSQLDASGQELTFQADMIKFVIARGYNLQETSHGIIGQFWNIPITVAPVDNPGSTEQLYSVTVEYPGGSKRSFVGMLWPLTWEYKEEYCLYSGNGQAGPLDEGDAAGGPNDPVIEGEYFQYKVESNFDTTFEYAHFEESNCIL